MAGPWEKYGSGRTGPISSGENPNVAIARQNAARGEEEFRYRRERDAATDREKEEKAAQEMAVLNEAKASSAASIKNTISVLEGIRKDANDSYPGILGERGWGETGTSGNIMRAIPFVSNAGKDLEAKVKTVKSMNAFTALKDLATQGIKLTPISNYEIDLAASSVANIDPSMSQREFLGAVDQAIKYHRDALKKVQAPSGGTAKPKGGDLQSLMQKYGGR